MILVKKHIHPLSNLEGQASAASSQEEHFHAGRAPVPGAELTLRSAGRAMGEVRLLRQDGTKHNQYEQGFRDVIRSSVSMRTPLLVLRTHTGEVVYHLTSLTHGGCRDEEKSKA